MTKQELLELAELRQIPVYDIKTNNKKAFYVDGEILVDFSRLKTEEEAENVLADMLARALSGVGVGIVKLKQCVNSTEDERRVREQRVQEYKDRLPEIYLTLKRQVTA